MGRPECQVWGVMNGLADCAQGRALHFQCSALSGVNCIQHEKLSVFEGYLCAEQFAFILFPGRRVCLNQTPQPSKSCVVASLSKTKKLELRVVQLLTRSSSNQVRPGFILPACWDLELPWKLTSG